MQKVKRYRNSLRAGRLLLRTLVFKPNKGKIFSDQKTLRGTSYDLYEPIGSTKGIHMMVYGLDYAGEKDPRLVHFAKAYVDSGFRVAIPKLPGLKSFAFEIGDVERIGDLISSLHRQYGFPIRITAFSVGAGLALVALSQYSFEEEVDLILMFSPYYSLPELWITSSSAKWLWLIKILNHWG
jgi:alpha-beta hydrolase superfamily lysophospholipase